MVIAIQATKLAKIAGPTEGCTKLISASGEERIIVMMELFQCRLDGKEMIDEWQISVLILISKGKGGTRNCNKCKGAKLLEHERVPERIQKSLNVYVMQVGIM